MKALVQENQVVNVVAEEALDHSFHPDVASLFVTVPDEVGVGWRFIDGVWVAPEASSTPLIVDPQSYVLDMPSFKMRFSPHQLVAVRASTDAVVKAFLSEIVDDPRTSHVNLALPFVQGAIQHLADLNLIAEGDVATILAPRAV